jgi:hypothetical protein
MLPLPLLAYLYRRINKQEVDKQNLISELINQAISKLKIMQEEYNFMEHNK